MSLLFVSYVQPKREKRSKRYKQDRQCTYNVTQRRVRATIEAANSNKFKYSETVFVFLGTWQS